MNARDRKLISQDWDTLNPADQWEAIALSRDYGVEACSDRLDGAPDSKASKRLLALDVFDPRRATFLRYRREG